MLKRVGSAALLLFSVIVLAAGAASGIEVSDSAFYYEQGKVTGVKGKTVYVAINTAKLRTLPKKHLQVELIDDTGNVRGIIGQIVMDEGALSGTMFLKSGATVSEGMHVRAKLPGFSPTTTSSSASSNDTCSTMPDGKAECTTKTGAQYNGKLKNGKPHGKGTMTMNNGNRYEGEFEDGFMEGDGKYIFKDGGYYEGEFKKNKFAGSGEQVFSSGARYKGDFKEDTRHGSGKYTFKDGGYYEGAFVDGKRTGQGILKMANGNEYEGEFKDGKFHGKGKLTFKAGGYWEGTFVDGKLNGKGLKVYTDGGRYEGDLVDDKRNGYGMLKMPNGNEYDGQFKDDKMHGKGIYKWASGGRYEGDYVDGKRSGKGTYTSANGKTRTGEFVDGKLVKEESTESTANTARASSNSSPAQSSNQSIRSTESQVQQMYSTSKKECNDLIFLFIKYTNVFIENYFHYLAKFNEFDAKILNSYHINKYGSVNSISFECNDDYSNIVIKETYDKRDGSGIYKRYYYFDLSNLSLYENKLFGRAKYNNKIEYFPGTRIDEMNEYEKGQTYECWGNECSSRYTFKSLVETGHINSSQPLKPSVMAQVKAIELAQKKLKDADVVYAKASSAYEALRCEEALKLDRQGQAIDGRSHSSSEHSDGYKISFRSCVSERNFKQVLKGKNPQSMYLTAGQYERNGEGWRAKEIYTTIVNRFPSSSWAVKANDRLLGIKSDSDARSRQSEFESNRRYEREKDAQSCRNRKSSCWSSCNDIKDYTRRSNCQSGCQSICSE